MLILCVLFSLGIGLVGSIGTRTDSSTTTTTSNFTGTRIGISIIIITIIQPLRAFRRTNTRKESKCFLFGCLLAELA